MTPVEGYARCTDPVSVEAWPGAQLELGAEILDPEWPGEPARPDGEGWFWTISVADLCQRFRLDRFNGQHVEILAEARGPNLPAVNERLHDYGPRWLFGSWTASGRRSTGTYVGVDIEGRGGAWVRAFEPDPWWIAECEREEQS